VTSPRALVLASTSPYRRELLGRLGLPFVVAAPRIDETPVRGEAPSATALRLAQMKARAVAPGHPGSLIVGSDQVAEVDGVAVSKPGSHEAALAQLRGMRGRTILFRTGVCLLDAASGRVQCDLVDVASTFRVLDDAEIENYLRRERPYDCAGAVKSEGLGIALFARIESDDPTALIGLPLIRLVDFLRREGVRIL
jgi:septum formation protein